MRIIVHKSKVACAQAKGSELTDQEGEWSDVYDADTLTNRGPRPKKRLRIEQKQSTARARRALAGAAQRR